MKVFRFEKLLCMEGWVTPAYVGIDDAGIVRYLNREAPSTATAVEHVSGYALPGFINAHSHAFQYAMAGLAERHPEGMNDDFWSWREAMYHCALSMDPDQMESIAAMLYVEMLRCGYTRVVEFHYLHHDKDGRKYANYSEMGERLLAAASLAGIRITLVPVFYQQGNFGVKAYSQQRRFLSRDTDDYLHLLDDSAAAVQQYRRAALGFGVHSLRAVSTDDVMRTLKDGPSTLPFHLHAAEQLKEVADAEKVLLKRPVQWLLDHVSLDQRFSLVHCTHLDNTELEGLARSHANVILCPGTEGNLGDGIFRFSEFTHHGGRFCIGTDSHISLNPTEDLRWLDYAQRLITHRRNTFDDGATTLLNRTFVAGRAAAGEQVAQNYFEAGQPFDAIIYNSRSPLLARDRDADLLPAIMYTTDSSALMGTIIDGHWIVKDGLHLQQATIYDRYRHALSSLRS